MRKKIGFIGVVLVLTLLGLLVIIVYNPMTSKTDKVTSQTMKMGEIFYTDFFYPQQALGLKEHQIVEKFSAMSANGIRISVDDIGRITEINAQISPLLTEVKAESDRLNCRFNSSMVVITPLQPFGEEDFDVAVILDCDA